TGMPAAARASHGFRVKPNPTPGRITVDLPDPLQRDSFYSVFDATGRLLYERPLPPGTTTTDIDLSRFGTGTYLLRITDPEGQRNERVVVE
nr:T9SS type A sorting domain-containing protein [Flavobacteriales bacterium]